MALQMAETIRGIGLLTGMAPLTEGIFAANQGAKQVAGVGLTDNAKLGMLVGAGVAVGAIVLGVLVVNLYAGQKLGRRMPTPEQPEGSAWGWFWGGLFGPTGLGILGLKRAGHDMAERRAFLFGAESE